MGICRISWGRRRLCAGSAGIDHPLCCASSRDAATCLMCRQLTAMMRQQAAIHRQACCCPFGPSANAHLATGSRCPQVTKGMLLHHSQKGRDSIMNSTKVVSTFLSGYRLCRKLYFHFQLPALSSTPVLNKFSAANMQSAMTMSHTRPALRLTRASAPARRPASAARRQFVVRAVRPCIDRTPARADAAAAEVFGFICVMRSLVI